MTADEISRDLTALLEWYQGMMRHGSPEWAQWHAELMRAISPDS